jgi:peptidoglycan/LPS O-acetylase OafA/YrhL
VDLTIYPVEPGDLIYHYGLLQGVGGFWTVPIEIHFYIVFVGIWWLYNRSRTLAIGGTLSVILWFFIDRTDAPQEFPLLDYIAYFLGGLVISLGIGKAKPEFPWTIAFICSGIFCFLLFPIVFAKSFGQAKWLDGTQMWHDPLCFFAVCALLGTSLLAPAARFVLANRFMTYSGRISYSIYLLHAPVIMYLIRFTPAGRYPVPVLALAFVISIILASISYRWIENPLRAAIGRAGLSAGRTKPGRQVIAS